MPRVGGSLRVLWLPPPLKTGRHDIAELLLKVAIKHQKSIKIINQQDKCLLLKKPQPVRHSFHL
jgi:hypothetical protein